MQNKKTHYKMYKSGKKWVFMGITTVSLVTVLGATTHPAKADNVNHSTPSVLATKNTDQTVSIQSSLDAVNKELANKIIVLLKENNISFNQISIGTADDQTTSDLVGQLNGNSVNNLKDNGYLIKSGTINNQTALAIQGKDATGLFYALNQVITTINDKQSVTNLAVYESPQMSIRGVIEGFYGQPWSNQARKDMFKFMGQHRMNTYIYSPKDDTYLRENWRKPYPQDKLNEIKELVDEAKKNHVEFVYALSPGNDITYSSTADYQATIDKFDQLRSIGVSQFYIALDDINPVINDTDAAVFPAHSTPNYPNNSWSPLADAQAYYLNKVQQEYVEKNNLPALWLVPTNYSGSAQDPFKEAQGLALDKDIHIQWTGEGVFSDKITADSINKAKETYHTDKLFIWDNFPVNDSNQDRLYLNPVVGRADDLYQTTEGFTSNPMIEPYASWIGIGSYADYMWNSSTYNPQTSLNNVLAEIAGNDSTVLDSLKAFADLNQYWDHGSADEQTKAPILSSLVTAYQKSSPGSDLHAQALANLKAQLTKIAQVPVTLQHLAIPGFYNDALPWINAASHWAKASLANIEITEALQSANPVNLDTLGSNLVTLKSEIAQAKVKAIVDGRTDSSEPAIIPSVGDGVFETLTSLNGDFNNLDSWFGFTPLKVTNNKYTGTASTQIPVYQNNGVANITDDSDTSLFWSSRNTAKGDTITLKLTKPQQIASIVLKQGDTDTATSGDMFTDATVYIGNKEDGSDKQAVGHIASSGLAQVDLSTPVTGQYVFIVANSDSSSWLKIRDLSVYGTSNFKLTNSSSSDGKSIQTLFDGSLTTDFTAKINDTSKSATIEQVSDTPVTNANSLVLVGKAKGTLYVRSNGTWQKVGKTDGSKQINEFGLTNSQSKNKAATGFDGIRLVLDPGSQNVVLSELNFSTKTAPVYSEDTNKNPETPSDKPTNTNKNTNKNTNTKKDGNLPQTGEQVSILASLAGLFLAGLAVLGFKKH